MTTKIDEKKAAQEDNIKKIKEELEKSKKEVIDYKNKYLRALADYQNYEKRVQDEKKRVGSNAVTFFILKLLSFLDHLEKAEIFIKDPNLTIIKESFLKILKEEGLEEIEVLGKLYDPHLAEAIEVVAGAKDNVVTEVLRKGYMLKGRILRVAQVKVSRKKS